MALQTSGPIAISEIQSEVGGTSYSLRDLSAAAGFSTPDAMSEFYGYSSLLLVDWTVQYVGGNTIEIRNANTLTSGWSGSFSYSIAVGVNRQGYNFFPYFYSYTYQDNIVINGSITSIPPSTNHLINSLTFSGDQILNVYGTSLISQTSDGSIYIQSLTAI